MSDSGAVDPISIEICVDSLASALAAQRGGARRVELCSDLLEGGITPSAGLVELVREKITIGLHVMIRPRGGDFCYTAEEFETMRRDIGVAKRLGVDGVVFGILKADASVDVERTRELVELARPLGVTFHRAFDVSGDLLRALEDVRASGVDRLLTSGGERTVDQGAAMIAALVKASRGRIAIMACGGISARNAAAVIDQTGVKEIHAGLRSAIENQSLVQNSRVSIGARPEEFQRFQVLEEDVRSLCRAANFAKV
jgi:copper homeostasis protein